MNATEINSIEPILHRDIHHAIVDSVDFISRKCKKLHNTLQEPDFIASLTINFTGDLFKILRRYFFGKKFNLTGIYCHQKPIVIIGSSPNPEIGDILFVYIYTDKTGRKWHNSLLFQAKISKTRIMPVPPADAHQLKLYIEWPLFSYSKAGNPKTGGLNGQKRDIQPKTITGGAQYLLIDDDPVYGLSGVPGTFPMGCAMPAQELHLNVDLARELVNFLKFKSGRTFDPNDPPPKDDWSNMIWDMLRIAEEKASKRKNAGLAGPAGFQRKQTHEFDGCCRYYTMPGTTSMYQGLHTMLRDSGGARKDENTNFNDEEHGAPSIILIESFEKREDITTEFIKILEEKRSSPYGERG